MTLMIGLVLMAAPAITQGTDPGTALGAADEGGTDANREILLQKVKADKKLLVATSIDLSNAEAKKFWPLYKDYQEDCQKELEQLNQGLDRTIKDYADEFNAGKGTISNDKAKTLLNEALSLEEAELKLKRTYAGKIGKVLPATETARYIRIENNIRAVLKTELAQQSPLVY